ncbi:MAG: hypothetical protein JSV19_00210 [Phycisphaerales bacterium]|nr:MAG: hypothetical protein JSV19_00210 [Phycisphaerales bacterium]
MALTAQGKPQGYKAIEPTVIPLEERSPKAAEMLRLREQGCKGGHAALLGLLHREQAGEEVDPQELAYLCEITQVSNDQLAQLVDILHERLPKARAKLAESRASHEELVKERDRLEKLAEANELHAGGLERLQRLRFQCLSSSNLLGTAEGEVRRLEIKLGLEPTK